MKIAIYSGTIPSTTFIEHLIRGVSSHHKVFLFGRLQRRVNYHSNAIKIHGVSENRIHVFVTTFARVFFLLLKKPKHLKVVLKEINKEKSRYHKWQRVVKILPVVLFLPDIFHVQWAKDLKHWMFLKEAFGVKLVLSLRGAHINYSPIADTALADSYKMNFPKVDVFHAVSKAIAIEAQKYNAEASKMSIIYSPLPESTLALFKTFEKPSSHLIKICVVGRFHWIKGMRYLFDALFQLKEKGIQFECICITSNTISEDVLFQINQLGLNKSITFKKNLNQVELFHIMQTCSMLVLPSLKEGIANVVLEAMAIGLPVISTDCGGMNEVVVSTKTGWLVPIRNSEAIAETIIQVSETPSNIVNEITNNAHQFVKENFNSKQSIHAFLQMYASLA